MGGFRVGSLRGVALKISRQPCPLPQISALSLLMRVQLGGVAWVGPHLVVGL